MRTGAIIQARMGSTRLPAKVLKDIGGASMLARVVQRVRLSTKVDTIIVATSVSAQDDAIVTECARLEAPVFRGSEDDVLDRFYQAACRFSLDAIVRITADCPLIDPGIIDAVAHCFLKEGSDYASNIQPRTFPRGLDTEIMRMDVLARAWQEAKETYQRVHVTPYINQNPGRFALSSIRNDGGYDYSHYRWTVDTREDLEFARAIYSRMGNRDGFGWREVISLLVQEQELAKLNQHVQQKPLHKG